MKKYHKIETLFKRDPNTHKLIVGDFRNETVEYLKDNKWTFTEKIDGTNIRVHWDGHEVTFGGRTDNAQIPKHLLVELEKLFKNEFNDQVFEQEFGEKEVTLYGEGYGPKIQKGGLYREEVGFILFDVEIHGETDIFLKREEVEEIAMSLNIDVVPVIMDGTIQEAIDYVLENENSTIGYIKSQPAKMEGLVGIPKLQVLTRLGKRVIVKIKRRDFN